MKKSDRVKVYEKYDGHCAYCGKDIEYKDMQVDHIQPKSFHGLDEMNNYNPSCRRCNHYKRGLLLEHYREQVKTLHERIQSQYISKVALDYGIIEYHKWNGTFYFELINELRGAE